MLPIASVARRVSVVTRFFCAVHAAALPWLLRHIGCCAVMAAALSSHGSGLAVAKVKWRQHVAKFQRRALGSVLRAGIALGV